MPAPLLLTTKLYMPPPRPNLVPRPDLLRRLDEGLQPGKRLILVSAPAGYGKTTLVSNWLRGNPASFAWLSMDEGDEDPMRFLQYCVAALQQIVPHLRQDLPDILQGMPQAPPDILVNLLINELAGHMAPFVLALDDFHVVHAQPVLEMIALLLERMPSQMHLVLLTRTDPPLPLSRLRARNQLVDIRAEQLRFRPDEVSVFLNQVMGLDLPAGDIAAMEARTEGWIAGLQLAAIAMQSSLGVPGRPDTHRFVSAFTGSQYYIMDYLAEEVLKLQPERVRTFLLQTSILNRMCGPLCEAVVAADPAEPVDGQAMLEALEQMNLFLVRLDDERRWYRYHHLFADVLNRHLEHSFPHQLTELHRRASRWHESSGLISEAIRHALLAGEQDRAAQLVEDNGCPLIMRGESTTLLHWIDAVQSQAQIRPWLSIQKAWALVLTERLEQAEQALQAAEQMVSALEQTAEVRTMLGCIASARAQQENARGGAHLAAGYARQALEYLPDDDPFRASLRCAATSILGDANWLNGSLEEARRFYEDAVRMSRAAGDVHMAIIATSNLADILVEQGQLHRAATAYTEALQMATGPDGQRLPLADSIYAGLSRVFYEWNDLEAAAQTIHQCIELGQRWGNSNLLAAAYVTLARLERALSNPEKAREAAAAVEQLASEHALSPRRSNWVRSALARLWLAGGDLDRVSYAVQDSGLPLDGDIPYQREPEHLVLLRLLLARGDHDAALALAGRLLHRAEAADRRGRIVELLILQALALQGKKETAQALSALGRAISLAQAEGYVRLFLDEGEPIARLLHQARARGIGGGFVPELLSAMDSALGTVPSPAQRLIEPLSNRELEVFRLIEGGYSNQEIADKLVISLATVKRHISTIYAKLGAKSRTQAISLGKQLELLG